MTGLHRLRAALLRRFPLHRRAESAPSVDQILADIFRKLRAMEPSADVQAIVTQLTALPAAISAQVASEVSTAEAAKDAQRATDIAAITTAVNAVASSVTAPVAAAA